MLSWQVVYKVSASSVDTYHRQYNAIRHAIDTSGKVQTVMDVSVEAVEGARTTVRPNGVASPGFRETLTAEDPAGGGVGLHSAVLAGLFACSCDF